MRHLYVRSNCKDESLVCLLVNGESLPYETELVALLRQAAPQTVGVVLGVNTRPGNAILGDRYRTLWGEGALTDVLCGRTVRLSVPSFYQVNHPQAEVLYGKALEFAGLTGTELAVDLYCGAGTITQVLARQARHVIGGEIVPEAIRDARPAPGATAWRTWSFWGGTPPTWRRSWPCGSCGRMSSAWTRPGRDWPRRSSPPSPPWLPGGWCMSPATPARWAGM